MKFKIGQTVELIDNNGMSAQLGATGVVEDVCGVFLYIQWKTDYGRSISGAYFLHRFKPYFRKNQQLEFAFMS